MTIKGVRVLIQEAYKTNDEKDRKALLALADEVLSRIENEFRVEPKEKYPISIFRNYKGKKYNAELLEGWNVAINGDIYSSPSAAAISISGNNENGWRAWRYLDESSNTVQPIDRLRQREQ